MDDPLSNRASIHAFRESKDKESGSGTKMMAPESSGKFMRERLMEMMGTSSDSQPLHVSHNSNNIAKQDDHADEEAKQFVEQFKREREAQKLIQAAFSGSDSDSGVEDSKKRKKKSKQKKNQKEVKNIRRKKPRTIVTEGADDIPMKDSEELLTRSDGNEVRFKYNNNIINHPEFNDKQLNRMDAKELQKIDSKVNPLTLQKFYYTEKDSRDLLPMTQFGGDEESDIEELESGLHSMSPSLDDLYIILKRLKKGIRSYTPQHKEEFLAKLKHVIEIATRKLDDGDLRTPMANERRCVRDDNCEGMNIPGAVPVINVERLTTSEKIEYTKTGKLPQTRRMCLMCLRYVVLFLYINIRSEGLSLRSNVILNRLGNITDKAGEYLFDQTIMNGSDNQGIPVPIIAHCRFYYKQKVKDGVTFWLQQGYPRPEEYARQHANDLLFS